jgi:hypothetical protein
MRWFVDSAEGKQPVNDVILDEKLYDAKALDKPEPHSYQVPVGVGVSGTGYVFASRQDGSLVMARRSATLEKVGDAVRFGLGPAAPTMPALAILGHQAAVFVGLYGKTDVMASTFAIEAKPAKPEKVAIDDQTPPAAGDRNSLTASTMPKGDIVSTEPTVSELRVVATGDNKAMVTYLAGNEIKTATVTCKY